VADQDISAQLGDLEACASALSSEASPVGALADEVGGAVVGGAAAGTTDASVALVAALTAAAAHWQGELAESSRLLGALGLAIDSDAMALRGADASIARSMGTPAARV
jgi:hypothetical protein